MADIIDCVAATASMANVKSAMEGVYDISEHADGLCCPNRGTTSIHREVFFEFEKVYNGC